MRLNIKMTPKLMGRKNNGNFVWWGKKILFWQIWERYINFQLKNNMFKLANNQMKYEAVCQNFET